MSAINDVMAVPACQFRYLLVADWTDTALFNPQAKQFLIALKVGFHLNINSTFKVSFPFGRIRICFRFDFNVPFYRRANGFKKPNGFGFAVCRFGFVVERPIIFPASRKVFSANPSGGFSRMSAPRPLPQFLVDLAIYIVVDSFADCVAVIVCRSRE